MSDFNPKKILQEIAALEAKLNDYFDTSIYDVIRDMTDEFWTLDAANGGCGHVGWSEENPNENPMIPKDEEPEHCYGEDVRGFIRKDEYTMVTIRTCTGDGDEVLIFDNSKEIEPRERCL